MVPHGKQWPLTNIYPDKQEAMTVALVQVFALVPHDVHAVPAVFKKKLSAQALTTVAEFASEAIAEPVTELDAHKALYDAKT